MRVLDTATILAAMAQVSPRERRIARAPERVVVAPVTPTMSGARTRSCHRPSVTSAGSSPGERGERGGDKPGEPDDGPRRSNLVVVPQGVIPIIVLSSRLAAASRLPIAS